LLRVRQLASRCAICIASVSAHAAVAQIRAELADGSGDILLNLRFVATPSTAA